MQPCRNAGRNRHPGPRAGTALGLLVVLSSPLSVRAGTYNVFGPESFVRSTGMVLTLGTPVGEPGKCSLTAAQPQVCVNSSLLINMHCQNYTQDLWEWIEPNGQRTTWELTRPTKQVNSASESRYTMAPELISVAPGHELNLTFPVTRWFSLSAPGSYSLGFRLHAASDSTQIESNKVAFAVKSCTDEAILAECRTFLKGQRENLEAVAGFSAAQAAQFHTARAIPVCTLSPPQAEARFCPLQAP
jgi:hypothetical protein